MSVLSDLEMGRGRIASGWCKGTWAMDSAGNSVDPDGGSAVRWCARGAVGSSFYHDFKRDVEHALYEALPPNWKGRSFGDGTEGDQVAQFNNENCRTDVLALFDRAISAERAATPERNFARELMSSLPSEPIAEDCDA